MSKNNGIELEHYGLVDAAIDADLREVRLSIKRGKDPLGQGTIERCVNWAMSRVRDRYPNYHLMMDGQVTDAAAT